ncbi:MAG: deoxyhypusine synthase family protein [Planctomycetales bacterium]|nr:deoxyhypusine synthase family protein [Planctomycetales bacterium]
MGSPARHVGAHVRRPSRKEILRHPVLPFEVIPGAKVSDVLTRMEDCSFQGRSLGSAFRIWREALADRTTIFLGLAGAMVPAGMRKILAYCVRERLVDCVVSTGANLFHDLVETLGHPHFQGDPEFNDVVLGEEEIDRIYDTYGDDRVFRDADRLIAAYASTLEARPYTTREFFYGLGRKLQKAPGEGIVKAAAAAGVPVYVPAIGDSGYGIAIVADVPKTDRRFTYDPVGDVEETAAICDHAPRTGLMMIGGGTPKNFIQQTEVTASLVWHGEERGEGHYYCVQLTADAPHWGGLSGCTFSESHSWGKIAKEAKMVAVYGDATIALPFLVTGLAEAGAPAKRPWKPAYDLSGREIGFPDTPGKDGRKR